MSHRIVIVDGDDQVLHGLHELLGAFPDMDIVDRVSDAHDAHTRIPELQPDAVVMEVALPGVDMARACAASFASRCQRRRSCCTRRFPCLMRSSSAWAQTRYLLGDGS